MKEKKGLITIEPDYKLRKMPSERLKEYHTKNFGMTKKGRILYEKVFGSYR